MKPDDENDRRPEPDHVSDPEAGSGASAGVGAASAGRPGTADVQAYIGRQLRAVYEDVVRQPIPDRFLALMKQLEEQVPEG
jgi:hypothetical protein